MLQGQSMSASNAQMPVFTPLSLWYQVSNLAKSRNASKAPPILVLLLAQLQAVPPHAPGVRPIALLVEARGGRPRRDLGEHAAQHAAEAAARAVHLRVLAPPRLVRRPADLGRRRRRAVLLLVVVQR